MKNSEKILKTISRYNRK